MRSLEESDFTATESRMVGVRGWGGGWGVFNEDRDSIWEDEMFLEMDGGDGTLSTL